MAVDVRTEPAFRFGSPAPVSSGDAPLGGNRRNCDIMPDGKAFLVVLPTERSAGARPAVRDFTVVLNWFEELKSRVPPPSR